LCPTAFLLVSASGVVNMVSAETPLAVTFDNLEEAKDFLFSLSAEKH